MKLFIQMMGALLVCALFYGPILIGFIMIVKIAKKHPTNSREPSIPTGTTQRMTEELHKEIELTYEQLVSYLLNKYGRVKGAYYSKEWVRNASISRTKEGLFIHHIDENKIAGLSSLKTAKYVSYEYQKADRLVYCNYFEHLLLHIKIAEVAEVASLGIEGAETISWEIRRCYIKGVKEEWKRNLFRPIAKDGGNYLRLCKYLEDVKRRKQ